MNLRLTPVGRMPGMPKRGRMPEMFVKGEPNKKVPLEFTLHTHVNRGKKYPYNSTKKNNGVLRDE